MVEKTNAKVGVQQSVLKPVKESKVEAPVTDIMIARANAAKYIIQKFWKFAISPETGRETVNVQRLKEAVSSGRTTMLKVTVKNKKAQTLKYIEEEIKLKPGTIRRVKAMINPNVLVSVPQEDFPDYRKMDKDFRDDLLIDSVGIQNDQKLPDLMRTVVVLNPKYKTGDDIEGEINKLMDESMSVSSKAKDPKQDDKGAEQDDKGAKQEGAKQEEEDDQASDTMSMFSRAQTVDIRLLDKLPEEQKTGAMYVITKGTVAQQMSLVKQLEELPNMDPQQKQQFANKLKRFSNLAKLGNQADKLYAQALLDKRGQILSGQVVLKTKQKVKK